MIKIHYEDEFCLVVEKPSNQLVHHSHFARNIQEQSLVDELREKGFSSACPVHRLDRKTSGLILFAKKSKDVADFQALFETGKVEKVYEALVRGWPEENGVINSPVKNERGNYKEAYTSYTVIKRFERNFEIPPYPTQRYALVEFRPKTGRYHQLRIHANKMNHPIINDPKHGNRHHNHYFTENLDISELFLHAKSITFFNPFTFNPIAVKCEKPLFWERFFNS